MTNSQTQKPVCIILCAPPGCGKTTFVAEHLSQFEVLSTDAFLLDLAKQEGKTYNEVWESSFGKAQKAYDVRFAELVAAKQSFVVDRTNLTAKSRARTLTRLSDDYRKIAFTFNIPPVEELERRIIARAEQNTQFVPTFVIADMISKYEEPSLDEGFNEIRLVRLGFDPVLI